MSADTQALLREALLGRSPNAPSSLPSCSTASTKPTRKTRMKTACDGSRRSTAVRRASRTARLNSRAGTAFVNGWAAVSADGLARPVRRRRHRRPRRRHSVIRNTTARARQPIVRCGRGRRCVGRSLAELGSTSRRSLGHRRARGPHCRIPLSDCLQVQCRDDPAWVRDYVARD